MRVDPVAALARWAAEDAEGRVMTLVEDPSFADWVPMVLLRLAAAEQAVLAYEEAVAQALRAAPNHWHQYRDPFELAPAIRDARRLALSLSPAPEQEKPT